MKTLNLILITLGCFALPAQGSPFQVGGMKIVSKGNLSSESGPTVKVEKDGLILAAHFPETAKDFDSLLLTLTLTNNRPDDLSIKTTSELRGFQFAFIKSSGETVASTRHYRELIFAGPPIGFETVIIKPGSSMVVSLLLRDHISVKEPGNYIFIADWRDLKMGAIGWIPDATPRIQLKSSIVLRRSGDGVSISIGN
jgi:hypothetical protein